MTQADLRFAAGNESFQLAGSALRGIFKCVCFRLRCRDPDTNVKRNQLRNSPGLRGQSTTTLNSRSLGPIGERYNVVAELNGVQFVVNRIIGIMIASMEVVARGLAKNHEGSTAEFPRHHTRGWWKWRTIAGHLSIVPARTTEIPTTRQFDKFFRLQIIRVSIDACRPQPVSFKAEV